MLVRYESELLAAWSEEQFNTLRTQSGRIAEGELREQCREFLSLLRRASQEDGLESDQGPAWRELRERLARLSGERARQGFTPAQTALFVFSFKQPLFARLREELGGDAAALADEVWTATSLLDRLGMETTDAYLRSREQTIARQQEELLELSTPVVKLWEGILALPLIGTLDSARTQVVMESLLQRVVETGAAVAIIDITGVPTVDTLVAQHLIKTVTAARLMGADCIISGIRPQIAQTIVHLGVNLGDIVTKATLADAFAVALQRRGINLARPPAR